MSQRRIKRAPGLGATGQYPGGKLHPIDEGQLRLAWTEVDGRFIVDFGTPVTWIGFDAASAQALGNALLEYAKKQAT